MKRYLSIIVVSLLLVLLSLQAAADESSNINVISKTDEGSSKYIEWKLETPQIKGLQNRKVERSINKEFAKIVNDFKNRLTSEAKKSYKESEKEGFPFRKFVAQTVYSVHYLDNNTLSLTMDLYEFTGGAHGFTTRLAFNYDLKTGKKLGYQEILKGCPNYKDIIVNEIIKQIEANPDIYFEDAAETVRGFTDEQPFYITNDGIVVYYGLYEIAPYASGIREFLIPYSAFKCCL